MPAVFAEAFMIRPHLSPCRASRGAPPIRAVTVIAFLCELCGLCVEILRAFPTLRVRHLHLHGLVSRVLPPKAGLA